MNNEIQKLPVEWVEKPIEHDNIRVYRKCSIEMINDEAREVRCRLNYEGLELISWLPFEAFEKSGVPIRGAQMFHIFGCIVENKKLVSWMEKYTPPMTPKKQKLLDEIMKL